MATGLESGPEMEGGERVVRCQVDPLPERDHRGHVVTSGQGALAGRGNKGDLGRA